MIYRVPFTVVYQANADQVARFKVHAVDCEQCRDGSDPRKLTSREVLLCEAGWKILTGKD